MRLIDLCYLIGCFASLSISSYIELIMTFCTTKAVQPGHIFSNLSEHTEQGREWKPQ